MSPDILALLIPITALLIPIVVILTKHQQKMAELMHGYREPLNQSLPNQGYQHNQMPAVPTQASPSNADVASMREDMVRLQNIVTTMALNMEELKDEIKRKDSIAERTRMDV